MPDASSAGSSAQVFDRLIRQLAHHLCGDAPHFRGDSGQSRSLSRRLGQGILRKVGHDLERIVQYGTFGEVVQEDLIELKPAPE